MAAQKKTIVISDVHISNGANYSWFKPPNSQDLTDLLNSIADGSSEAFSNVEELVLLGDLFDLWLYPVTEMPLTVAQIIARNKEVTEALQRCVGKIPKVYYMNGNHDMSVKCEDLEAFNSGVNKIICIDTSKYNELHANWHFEHGHEVDMFNAPVPKEFHDDTIGGYPLGYFMTRLGASAPSTVWQGLQEIFGARHEKLRKDRSIVSAMGSGLVKAIIDYFLSTTEGVDSSTKIRFLEPDLDGQITVDDIKKCYGSLYGRWFKRYGFSRILDSMLASRHFVGLDWYAEDLLSGDNPPKVVVMGHTHDPVHKLVQSGEYDNDGCFCGDAKLSYVEIVGDTATVRSFLREPSS